jgi:hypothetical protein
VHAGGELMHEVDGVAVLLDDAVGRAVGHEPPGIDAACDGVEAKPTDRHRQRISRYY